MAVSSQKLFFVNVGNHTAVALFPGHSHLQSLIACSMQIWQGKAGEMWSRVVPSGRQMVDTQGVVPNENFDALSCTVHPKTGLHVRGFTRQATNTACCSKCQGRIDVKQVLYRLSTWPRVSTLCLPDDIACDQVSQAFPCHICILQAIKHWWWWE